MPRSSSGSSHGSSRRSSGSGNGRHVLGAPAGAARRINRSPFGRVGYVVKRYPRFSETFIVTEIIAHEAAGLAVEIFALLPCTDSHFQDAIARVRAPVNYLPAESVRGADLWQAMRSAAALAPKAWDVLRQAAEEGTEPRDLYQALALAQAVQRKRIVHLHAHFATSAVTVARLASMLSGVPYTFTAHAKDIFHTDVDPQDLRRKLRDAAGVVTVSDYNRRFLGQGFGRSASSVRRVYNGLELDRFPFQPPAERSPLIAGVGRLVEKKGFGDLIEACRLLRAQGRTFTCRIAGEGELAGELEAQVQRCNLSGVVILLGPRPQPQVVDLLRSAAVFAAPCVVGADGNRDGLPTVLLEAMALGAPCVSTDVTGIPEVVLDGRTGLVVPQRDPAALAAALGILLDNVPLRVRLATAARALIEAQYDVRRNAAIIRDMFADAAPAPSPKRKKLGRAAVPVDRRTR